MGETNKDNIFGGEEDKMGGMRTDEEDCMWSARVRGGDCIIRRIGGVASGFMEGNGEGVNGVSMKDMSECRIFVVDRRTVPGEKGFTGVDRVTGTTRTGR